MSRPSNNENMLFNCITTSVAEIVEDNFVNPARSANNTVESSKSSAISDSPFYNLLAILSGKILSSSLSVFSCSILICFW